MIRNCFSNPQVKERDVMLFETGRILSDNHLSDNMTELSINMTELSVCAL